MVTFLKWYFMTVGFVCTVGIAFGGVWFLSLPSQVQNLAWSFVFPGHTDGPVLESPSEVSARVTTVVENGTSLVATATQAIAPVVNNAQAEALKSVGIDPSTVPASFTPEQIACFESILGTARVTEIKNGAVPTFAEFTQSAACF